MVAGFEPIEVERAAGCLLYGRDGREYLDCFSGIAVVNAGHGHPRVLAAAREQMERLVHCCTYVYYNPRAGEFARRLAEAAPGRLQKSFFGSGGAEAIEGALRLAKQFTRRKELVALTQSFHGRSAATLSITGNRGRKKGSGPYLSGVAFAPAPYCYRCPFKLAYPACAEHMDHVLKYQTAGDVAAFISEPVMGEGGPRAAAGGETGNLIARLEGDGRGTRRLPCTHLDLARLGTPLPTLGYNFDGSAADEVKNEVIGAERMFIDLAFRARRRALHAGPRIPALCPAGRCAGRGRCL